MITFQRTNSKNDDFVELVRLLDADLAIRDGKDHAFYSQFNKIDKLNHVVIAFEDGVAIGCGAMKAHSSDAVEIKRMYTSLDFRGKGVASKTLHELEQWAAEIGCKKCVLETGIRQPEAIALYLKNGYSLIPNYGQYEGVADSRCFAKSI